MVMHIIEVSSLRLIWALADNREKPDTLAADFLFEDCLYCCDTGHRGLKYR